MAISPGTPGAPRSWNRALPTPPSQTAGLQSLLFSHSVMSVSATPWTAARQASLPFGISQSLLKLMSIELVMPSNHLILCGALLLPPSTFPSIRVFSSESALHIRWPKDWSFSFSIRTGPQNREGQIRAAPVSWCAARCYGSSRKSPQHPWRCAPGHLC